MLPCLPIGSRSSERLAPSSTPDALQRRLAITVDDGYRDQLQAAEVLRSLGVPGSFFICTGFIDEPHHAWWDEIAWLTSGPPTRDLILPRGGCRTACG